MNDEFCSSCGRLEKECICNSKEFCLNDEVRDCPCNKCNSKVIYLEDVKEFIRLLKQEFRIELKSKQTPEAQKDKVCNQLLEDLYYKPLDKVIDKLAGSKLL